MRTLCEAVADVLANRARRHGVVIDVDLCHTPATVIGFAELLENAVRHLVSNAIAAMPRGGHVTLRVYCDPVVVVECCDDGPGIPANQLASLWDAHDRLRQGGLPATRATIEAHQGKIWYRDQPGGGACFMIELPAAGPRSTRRSW